MPFADVALAKAKKGMSVNMEEEVRNIEYLMLAQFIEVLNDISEFNSIEEIKNQIFKRKKEYLEILKNKDNKIDFLSVNLSDEFINKKIQKGKGIYSNKNSINEVYLAYKIGLIDGMKIKSE